MSLLPIWKFICEVYSNLEDKDHDIPVIKTSKTESAELEVYYKIYKNNFKKTFSSVSHTESIGFAVDQGMTLGISSKKLNSQIINNYSWPS